MARDSRETESATLPFDDLPAPRRSVEVVGEELPLLATRDDVYFPGQVFPLAVVRPQERDAVKAALAADRRVVVVATRLGASESPCPADFYSVGIVAEILSLPSGDGETEGMAILLEGVSRVRAEISGSCEMRRARVVPLAEPAAATGDPRLAALARTVRAGFEELTEESIGIPPDAVGAVRAEIDPLGLPNLVAPWLEAPVATKQALLEETHAERRLERLAALIQRERDNLRVDPILDDDSSDGGVWEELFQRLETAAPPLEIARRAESALKRLARAPASTAETEGLQHWIETLLSIPWNAEAEERVDLPEAERLLDAAHFGQESVKERLLEFLAVRKLAGNRLRPPLLCFVGAPGVGKTSVALSLAEALGRPCVRVALGGVRDEAEIRGHRRTYVGAMPGRIVAAIRQSGVKNPVIVLDELDKLASDLRGDPASALLEALDPEQNHAFHDHYLDVPLDLSQVLFVATANRADTILPALRDRLELVAFPSYTEREKVGIAQKHLLPQIGRASCRERVCLAV